MTKKKAAIICLIFLQTHFIPYISFSQTPKKGLSAQKKTTIPIAKLNAKLTIDTTCVILQNNGNSDFSLIYSKETTDGFGFKMKFNNSSNLELEDFKVDYIDEKLTTINKVQYLETHADSSTIKIKDLKYWFEKVTFRPVPIFYAEMKKQAKLSSKDMTTYLNSDSESWKKSENNLHFYTVNKFTNDLIIISVFYYNEDAPHINEIEQKAKEIISGFVLLPSQSKK